MVAAMKITDAQVAAAQDAYAKAYDPMDWDGTMRAALTAALTVEQTMSTAEPVSAKIERYYIDTLEMEMVKRVDGEWVSYDDHVAILAALSHVPPEPVSENPMQFFAENVDQCGAAEWFDHLVKAVREHDKAVVAKDEPSAETYRMIASSSAMRLVRDYEPVVRAALSHVQAPAPVAAPVQEWRDISTAPKDGTAILAFNCRHMPHAPVVVVWKTDPDVEMVGDEPHWADAATKLGTALYYNGNYFSHWMLLPPSPDISGDTSNG
jgi:hypothetical protein